MCQARTVRVPHGNDEGHIPFAAPVEDTGRQHAVLGARGLRADGPPPRVWSPNDGPHPRQNGYTPVFGPALMDPDPHAGPSGSMGTTARVNGSSMSEEEQTAALYGAIQEAIQREVTQLYEKATEIANEFWDIHFWYRNHSSSDQWGSYGVRVRQRATTVSIDWYRMVWYGPAGNRSVTHNHLKRGNTARYKRTTFKNARAWEIEAIMAAEARFEKLRRAADRLVSIGQHARYYDATVQALDAASDDEAVEA